MYYETHGSGDPVVLVHGGLGGAIAWTNQVPALSQRYEVVVPEQRGRGRTPDSPGPISYQALADDLIGFLSDVVRAPAHLVGASDGGVVGLVVAMQRPDLLRRSVCIGGNFHHEGLLEASGWKDLPADDDAWAPARRYHSEVSPDGPAHWPVIFDKLQRMWREQPTYTAADIATIAVPTLVVSGDDDAVSLDHTVELYEALRYGQLAVIPGTSHVSFLEKPDLVNRLILDFLAEEGPPQTMLPIRRRAASDGHHRR